MEKNEISKTIKQMLNRNGLKHLKVKGGTGTAWGWIEIFGKDYGCFTEEDNQKFEKLFGERLGLGNCVPKKLGEWEAIIGKARARGSIQAEVLKNLYVKFNEIASNTKDWGTCCGGSGLEIFYDGVKIDFWRNVWGQSVEPLVVAKNKLLPVFTSCGFTVRIEEGWVD